MFKSNYLGTRYARDVLNVSSDELRAKVKSEDLKNLLNFLKEEFEAILKTIPKFYKQGNTYLIKKE